MSVLGIGDSLLLPLTSIPEEESNGSKRLSPTPSVSNLSLRPCRYLSTVTRNSNQGSVDGFRRERLQRLATFDSPSVQKRLEVRSRMESGTIVYYLYRRNLEATGAVGANLWPFSFGGSVGPLRWSPQPSGKPLYREKTVYRTTH